MATNVQYLRNEKGKIEMMPLIGWHTESFGYGLLLQVRFAETPEDLTEGMLGVVQLGVSAEQALLVAKELTNLANQILATQATQINKSLQ